jgi:hypothetical protein
MLKNPTHWSKLYAAHLAGRAQDAAIPLKWGHAQELAAAGAGAESLAALKTGAHPASREHAPLFQAECFERRLQVCDNLGDPEKRALLQLSEQLFIDGDNPDVRLAWQLAEHCVNDCENHPEVGFVGSVVLPPKLAEAAGEVACQDDFQDGLFEDLPWPSIAPFAHAKPDKSVEGNCLIEPGAVLNVIAALADRNDLSAEAMLRHTQRLKPGLRREG